MKHLVILIVIGIGIGAGLAQTVNVAPRQLTPAETAALTWLTGQRNAIALAADSNAVPWKPKDYVGNVLEPAAAAYIESTLASWVTQHDSAQASEAGKAAIINQIKMKGLQMGRLSTNQLARILAIVEE